MSSTAAPWKLSAYKEGILQADAYGQTVEEALGILLNGRENGVLYDVVKVHSFEPLAEQYIELPDYEMAHTVALTDEHGVACMVRAAVMLLGNSASAVATLMMASCVIGRGLGVSDHEMHRLLTMQLDYFTQGKPNGH